MSISRAVGALVLCTAVAIAGACGGDASADGTPGAELRAVDVSLPAEMAGLAIHPEESTNALSRVDKTYLEASSFFSLRRGDLVEATLQIGRFEDKERYRSVEFRQALVNRLGGSSPVTFRLGRQTVYITRGTRQNVSVWFRGRHMLILTAREAAESPRALLREALEVEV